MARVLGWKQVLVALIPPVVFGAMMLFLDVIPRTWVWAITPVLVLAVAAAIVLVDRKTRVLEEHHRAGRCGCGFDLRAAPPRKVTTHSYGVDERMSSTRKTIVCPECGLEHAVWGDE